MSGFSDFIFEAELVARSIGDYFSGAPLRLGVTGLSRAGKTVFLTAARQQSDRGRAPAGAGRLRRGAHHAGAARTAAGRRGAALRLRGASEEPLGTRSPLAAVDQPHRPAQADDRVRERGWLGLAALDASPSISSTIPANGCSTCRSSTRPTPNGRARRWRQARLRRARRWRNNGARRWSASIRRPTPTRKRRGASPNCSPPISSGRATMSMRSQLCHPAGS